MEDHTPNIEDPKFPNNASNTSSIIIGAIVLLCMILGSLFLFYTLPTDEEAHLHSPSSMSYPASSSTSISPTTSMPASGTYMKLSVTPDNPGDDMELQVEACAQILSTKFSAALYPITVSPGKGFIELHIGSAAPADINEVTEYLTTKGELSIHLVHRQTRTLAAEVASRQKIIPGYAAFPHINIDPTTGATTTQQILINTKAEITGDDVKSAYVSPRDFSVVNIELTNAGGKKMEAFTLALTKNIDMIATVLDGKVMNYATLNAERLGRNFVITGLDSKKEAETLCRSLQSPLTSTLKIIEQRPYSK